LAEVKERLAPQRLQYFSSTEISLPHDGQYINALRVNCSLFCQTASNVPLGNQDRNGLATEVREKEAGCSDLIGLLNPVGSALPNDNYNSSQVVGY
jgi:hypothetical protein